MLIIYTAKTVSTHFSHPLYKFWLPHKQIFYKKYIAQQHSHSFKPNRSSKIGITSNSSNTRRDLSELPRLRHHFVLHSVLSRSFNAKKKSSAPHLCVEISRLRDELNGTCSMYVSHSANNSIKVWGKAASTLQLLHVNGQPSRTFRPLYRYRAMNIPTPLLKCQNMHSTIYALRLARHTYKFRLLQYSSNEIFFLTCTTFTATVHCVSSLVSSSAECQTIRRLDHSVTSDFLDTSHCLEDVYKFFTFTLQCSTVYCHVYML